MHEQDEVRRNLKSIIDVALELAWRCGMKEDEVKNLVEASLNRAKNKTPSLETKAGLGSANKNFLAAMLGAWYRDAKYVDDLGSPLPLEMVGASPSLESLYALTYKRQPEQNRTLTQREAIELLLEHGTIESTKDGRLVPNEVVFRVSTKESVEMKPQLSYLAEYAETVFYNLDKPAGDGRMCITANVDRFPKSELPRVNKMIGDEVMRLMKSIDAVLVDCEERCLDSEEKTVRFGVGAYIFERENK